MIWRVFTHFLHFAKFFFVFPLQITCPSFLASTWAWYIRFFPYLKPCKDSILVLIDGFFFLDICHYKLSRLEIYLVLFDYLEIYHYNLTVHRFLPFSTSATTDPPTDVVHIRTFARGRHGHGCHRRAAAKEKKSEGGRIGQTDETARLADVAGGRCRRRCFGFHHGRRDYPCVLFRSRG